MVTPHKPEQKLPPLGRYVLIHVPDRPWLSDSDQEGVHWVVAKRVLSVPYHVISAERPYYWAPFGPGTFDAREVVAWCELPRK